MENRYEPLESKFGTVYFTLPYGKDYIFLTTNPDTRNEPVTFSRVEYNIAARMHRWSDGKFHAGTQKGEHWREPGLTRADLKRVEISSAAKNMLRTELERIANEFAVQNPEKLEQAELELVERYLANARKEEEEAAVEYQRAQEVTVNAAIAVEQQKLRMKAIQAGTELLGKTVVLS